MIRSAATPRRRRPPRDDRAEVRSQAAARQDHRDPALLPSPGESGSHDGQRDHDRRRRTPGSLLAGHPDQGERKHLAGLDDSLIVHKRDIVIRSNNYRSNLCSVAVHEAGGRRAADRPVMNRPGWLLGVGWRAGPSRALSGKVMSQRHTNIIRGIGVRRAGPKLH